MSKQYEYKQDSSLVEERDPEELRYIYLLIDPRNNKPFYVGQARCIITRLGQHLSCTPHYNPSMDSILQELKAAVLTPKVQVLEVVNGYSVKYRERYWVHHYYTLYPDLCNKFLIKGPKHYLTNQEIQEIKKKNKEKRLANPSTEFDSFLSDDNLDISPK